MTSRFSVLTLIFLGVVSTAAAQYTPTISGIHSWWWLGAGILYDGAGCSTNPPGACYWAEEPLTASPNGAPGTPTWTVQTNPGGGAVTLNCYTCTSVVATASAPSSSCSADVTVYVSYGGYQSAAFTILINSPAYATQTQDPTNAASGSGYLTTYMWGITDTCGNEDPGMDGNESFGNFTDDYAEISGIANNWPWSSLVPGHLYDTGWTWADRIGAVSSDGSYIPDPTNPQTPLSAVLVEDDTPWSLNLFTQTIGDGLSIFRDDQQWYIDHGEHP